MTAISLSTHVLDTAAGLPVEGVPVELARRDEQGDWLPLGGGLTDADGRIADLTAAGSLGTDPAPAATPLTAGHHRISFYLEAASSVERSWYPEVHIVVDLDSGSGHVHVPLLLAPYGYTTYRGS